MPTDATTRHMIRDWSPTKKIVVAVVLAVEVLYVVFVLLGQGSGSTGISNLRGV